MPRFVSSFVSELGGVGPALASAFSVVAIVGVADVIAEAVEKFSKWKEVSGETANKMQDLTASIVRQKDSLDLEDIKLGNVLAKLQGKPENHLAEAIEEVKIKADELGESIAHDLVKVQELLSKGPGAMSAVLLGTANISALGERLKPLEREYELALLTQDVQAQKNVLLKEQKIIQDALNRETETKRVPLSSLQGGAGSNKLVGRDADPEAIRTISQALKAVNEEMGKLEKMPVVGNKLKEIAKAKDDKEYLLGLVEADQRDLEMRKKAAEQKKKDDEEAKRLQEEKDRNEEQIAADAQARYKKDQEALQVSMVGKVKLLEEGGKNELEQIRANTAMQEKVTAVTSAHGGGDKGIKAEALAGYQQETAAIQKMIAAEEELRQVFASANMAHDDPKMLESEQREQALVQQLKVAWQTYQKTVETVAAANAKAMMKSIEQVGGDFNKSFVSWMNGSERFSQAMQHVWTSIADTAAEKILQIGEKWLMQHVLMTAIDKLFHVQSAAEAAASATAQIAAAKASGLALAGLAGAGGTASMAAAPFPMDLTAPAFGAAMMAAAAGFNAFEKGGIVPSTGMSLVHANEMILPSHISQSVQRMADSGAAGGGGHTFHYNPTINGSSSASVKDMLDQHGKHFVDYAIREMRRKNVG